MPACWRCEATIAIPATHSRGMWALGLQDRLGCIRAGSDADLVLLDEQLNLVQVIMAGGE